jgi:protein-S-isoprenylcysteine O-methyltransferase Ste14
MAMNEAVPPARRQKEDRRLLTRLQKQRKLWLRLAVAGAGIAILFLRSSWPEGGVVNTLIETTGLALIALCILGRAWSILYIGGRKASELVDHGPYSVTRNPLYVFSFLGALGVGFQSGSLVIGLAALVLAAIVFVPVVRREEEVLARTFGAPFEAYCQRVPRFWPRLALWRDPPTVSFAPPLLYSTLRDSLVFAAAYPLFELVELLQDKGILPVLAWLP